MPKLYVCEHQLELITRAVAAYKPAQDEEEDHGFLMDFLRQRASESAILDDLNPEDIPF